MDGEILKVSYVKNSKIEYADFEVGTQLLNRQLCMWVTKHYCAEI